MEILLKIIHVIASIFLIMVVLLQSGRGGGMGAAFGGASGQIFGGRGAGNFLTKLTSGSAIVFFVSALTLSMMSSRHRSVLLGAVPKTAPVAGDAGNANDKAGDEKAGKADDAGAKAQPAPTSETVRQATPADAKGAPAAKPDAPAPTPPGVPTGSGSPTR